MCDLPKYVFHAFTFFGLHGRMTKAPSSSCHLIRRRQECHDVHLAIRERKTKLATVNARSALGECLYMTNSVIPTPYVSSLPQACPIGRHTSAAIRRQREHDAAAQ